MPRQKYIEKKLRKSSMEVIDRANEIIEIFQGLGFDLTLRQLYYQFVSRNWLTNTEKSYDRLGNIISDGRLLGLVDWSAIVDRTRNLVTPSSWSSPRSILRSCSTSFAMDAWKDQEYRPEVWVEKDALIGVFGSVCDELRIPYFACRGYSSQSEMWSAGQRLLGHIENEQKPVIFHFGDHDPSGIDMSRDIADRLKLFIGESADVRRIALNMSQVNQYNPPPNPAKTTDIRYASYLENFGDESWELDALDPQVLVNLVRTQITMIIDQQAFDDVLEEEQDVRRLLGSAADRWEDVTQLLDEEAEDDE